ncbi:MAG TPA: hypothetical protein VLA66_06475 [Thermoanaerobaculia bacterium]|nr:hypothetical protein [Thermoanaerobaculia bacterium]
MRRWILALALALPASPLLAVLATEIFVVSGTTGDGAPTELWQRLVRRHSGEKAAAASAALRRPPSAAEQAWEQLIRTRALVWNDRLAALAAPFAPVRPPEAIWIVLGNRDADDAFTHDRVTIGFDLSRLVAVYGPATEPENRARIDRFFDHESTHLLQKAWLERHPQAPATPVERAELGIWLEGLGNWYSLSDRWRSTDGVAPEAARAALAELEPLLVERMEALVCAGPADEARLTADLSMGPFTKKWGALPAALWLEAEASRSPDAVRDFVEAGPAGVPAFARRHLPAPLAARLDAARERGRSCPGRDAERSP